MNVYVGEVSLLACVLVYDLSLSLGGGVCFGYVIGIPRV